MTLVVICSLGTLKLWLLFKVILDLGSTKTMIHNHTLSIGWKPVSFDSEKMVTTLARSMIANKMVNLRYTNLPEFDKKCRHNIILGADFLRKYVVDINYSKRSMKWFKNIIHEYEQTYLKHCLYLLFSFSWTLSISCVIEVTFNLFSR